MLLHFYITIYSRSLSFKDHEGCAFPLQLGCRRCDSQSRRDKNKPAAAWPLRHQNSPSYQQMQVIPLYFFGEAVSYKINKFPSEKPNTWTASFWHVYPNIIPQGSNKNSLRAVGWKRHRTNLHFSIACPLNLESWCLCLCRSSPWLSSTTV